MARKIESEEKRVLRDVVDRAARSPKPLGPELAEDIRQWLRDAADQVQAPESPK